LIRIAPGSNAAYLDRAGEVDPVCLRHYRAGADDPTVIICVDEFGPLYLQPHPGKQRAPIAAGKGDVDQPRRRRRRATYTRPHGVRHMMGAYDLSRDRRYGHIVPSKDRTAFLRFLRYICSWYPPEVRIGIVLDNSHRICRRRRTSGSVRGPRRTTSNSPTRRRTRRG
jgi:hypothetical protein